MKLLSLLPWNKKSLSPKKEDAEIQAILEGKASSDALATNTQQVVTKGILAVLIGFGGFLLWGGLAPLDTGVPAMGTVVVDSKRKIIQHLTGGLVERIEVKEGAIVKKGDVLIRLNKTQADAQFSIVKTQLMTSRSVESRLLAERQNLNEIKFHPFLIKNQHESHAKNVMESQRQLFTSRRNTLKGELNIIDENIRGLADQIAGLKALQQGKAEQIRLLTEELKSLKTLFEQGYVPRNRIFELERAIADISANKSNELATIARVNSQLSELRLRALQRKQEYQKEIETQLTEVQKEANSLEERSIALEDELNRIEVRAPTDGVVVNLSVHTVGGVIRPGEQVMEIVPVGEQLIIEAQVEPQRVEKVHPGLITNVQFAGLDRLTPVVQGKVLTISADRLMDQRTGMAYYLARISVAPDQIQLLGRGQKILPGMPANVVIKTGEHNLLYYLVKPLTDQMFYALKEQ